MKASRRQDEHRQVRTIWTKKALFASMACVMLLGTGLATAKPGKATKTQIIPCRPDKHNCLMMEVASWEQSPTLVIRQRGKGTQGELYRKDGKRQTVGQTSEFGGAYQELKLESWQEIDGICDDNYNCSSELRPLLARLKTLFPTGLPLIQAEDNNFSGECCPYQISALVYLDGAALKFALLAKFQD